MKSDWKVVKLKDVCDIKYGKDHKKLNDGVIPVYGSGGLMRHVDTPIHNKKSVLIPRKGTLSNLFLVDPPFWTVDTLFWTDINTDLINPDFLYYQLCTMNLESRNVGTAVPSLTTSILKEINLVLPSLEEQEIIVAGLLCLDQKIKVNNHINDNLEQQAIQLYDHFFSSYYGDSGKNCTLGDISNITMGQSPAGSSYNEIGIGEVFYQGRAEFGFRFPQRRLYTTEPKKIAQINDILLSVRAPVGDMNIANERCCIGRGLAAIRSKYDVPSFLFYTLKKLITVFDIYNGQGTVFGSINNKDLNAVSIPDIPKEKVQEFERNVGIFDKRILNNSLENQRLCSLRDSLLPRLMSGEINISSKI